MQLSVKQLDGTKKDYNVESDQTVLQLKEEISETTGVPIDQMRLIHGGKMLDDSWPMSDCKLNAGDVVNMVMNLWTR